MSENKNATEKISKANFVRSWLKSNKDFSSKWMVRLFKELEDNGYKVAKNDSIYVYSIKSQLNKLSKSGKVKNAVGSYVAKTSKPKQHKNNSNGNSNSFYRVAALAWSLKSWLQDKSCDMHDLQEAIKLLDYLDLK